VRYLVLLCVLVFVLANLFFLLHLLRTENDEAVVRPLRNVGGAASTHSAHTAVAIAAHVSSASASSSCLFRHYPSHRYYKLSAQEQPEFLVGAGVEYIYGQWPMLLQAHQSQRKLCVDQSEWLPLPSSELPFADGTNPSILTVPHIQKAAATAASATNNGTIRTASAWLSHYPTAAHVATACMTNSQCRWKDDSPTETTSSRSQKPATVRTVLLVLDAAYQTLGQATVYLERDAAWGRRVPAANETGTGQPVRAIKPLDDARLFLHGGNIWVSYREGAGFGWDNQVLNPIHLDIIDSVGVSATTANGSSSSSNKQLTATVRASETQQFCCGRNMALMENLQQPELLQSLTWVDPVTVIDVPFRQQQQQSSSTADNHGRRLAGQKKPKKRTSHIHGTNAFMVYLPSRNEFLGMGHFHRPNDRDPNEYARFGHHYTHTFFTVSAHAPFQLKALSPEFVLQSTHHKDDAEIIQFASGLELSDDKLIIAYGVNDCEAGVVEMGLGALEELLRPVEAGRQVLDYMLPLSRS